MTRGRAPTPGRGARAPRRWTVGTLAVLGLVAAGCAVGSAIIPGMGGIVTEARAMPYFTEVRVAGPYNVRVLAGATPDVTIYADASLLHFIDTSVEKNTLSISTRRGTELRPSRTPRLNVFTGQLLSLTATGAGTVDAAKVSGDAFTARFAGAEESTLSGSVQHLTIEVTGTADVDARRLPAEIVDVLVSGVGHVAVAARDRLTVTISGAGRVTYAGRPREIVQHITGAGVVLAAE